MDTCPMKFGWDIRQAWSACKARAMDGYGFRSITMQGIRSLAHKPKGSCGPLRNAADSIPSGARNSCKSELKRWSKTERLPKNDGAPSRRTWKRLNAGKKKCQFKCEKKRSPNASQFSS